MIELALPTSHDLVRSPIAAFDSDSEYARRPLRSDWAQSTEPFEEDAALRPDALGAYLAELPRFPLLTAAEEIALAREIRRGEQARVRLSEEALTASADELQELRDAIARGSEARRRMIESNLRLVISIARRHAGFGACLADLAQEGNLGLIRAVEKFDPELGYRFSTYATWWIRQAISRSQAERGHPIRLPVHIAELSWRIGKITRRLMQETGQEPTVDELAGLIGVSSERVRRLRACQYGLVSLDAQLEGSDTRTLADLVVDESAIEPADAATSDDARKHIDEAMATLSPRERLVLRLRFGLGGQNSCTLGEAATAIGISRERVRQIEAAGLKKLGQTREVRELRAADHEGA